MKYNLVINGAAGRMGKTILALAAQEDALKIIAAIEKTDHPDLGKDPGTLAGIEPINIKLDTHFPTQADVMIDFSLPEAADKTLDNCTKNNVALVMGTTGLSQTQLDKLKKAAKKIPVVYATNMSVGMNMLFNIAPKIAHMLGQEYDIEIIEAHHRFKKDAPSGSALTLAKNIAEKINRQYPQCLTHGRHGKDNTRQKNTIGIHAIRAGDITGQHSVIFSTLGETVTISHNAHNRNNFARGAVRAAIWITDKKPALYSMAHVLSIA
jgi:4-hydroxy-tetrahydrodipicolinate reductase